MPTLRLALNQVDTTVGDSADHAERIVRWTRHAAEQGAHLVAFPLARGIATQSPSPEASHSAVLELARRLAAEGLGETPVVLGHRGGSHTDDPCQDSSQNCAALLHRGQAVTRPDTLPVLRLHGVDVASAVGTEAPPDADGARAVDRAEAGLLLLVAAEPYAAEQGDRRLELVRRQAERAGSAVACVNPVGGEDESVFDGDSVVVDAKGQVLARAPQFEEGCLLVDLDLPAAGADTRRIVISEAPAPEPAVRVTPGEARRMDELEAVYAALVCGVRAFVAGNGVASVLLGLSGGLDSALVAALAVDALGAEHVYGVAMPSAANPSRHAREDAAESARRTGLHLRTVPITPVLDAHLSALGLTGPAGAGLEGRVRATLLAALAEQEGRLLLAPADRTVLLTPGHATPYGESVGDFGPLKDVDRLLALRLAQWRNTAAAARGETPPIPERVLAAPATPGPQDVDAAQRRPRHGLPGVRIRPRRP